MTEGVLPGPLSAAAQVPAARARRRTRSQIFTDGMPPAAPAAAGTGGRSGTGGTGHVGGTGSAADISDVTDAGSGTDSGGDDGISGTGTSHTGDAEGPGGASATGRCRRDV